MGQSVKQLLWMPEDLTSDPEYSCAFNPGTKEKETGGGSVESHGLLALQSW